MHKLSLAVTPAFVLALAMSAVAQEKPITTKKDMVDTVKVNVSGRLVLDYVWRSSELEDAVVTGGTLGTGESENTFEGYAAVRFDIELTDKVSAVVEVGTERVDAGAINAWGQASASAGLDVVLREAHVLLGDFLTPGLWLQVGIETWAFDVRGKGSAFAFDPRHSQSFARNIGGPIGSNTPEELQPVGGVFTYKREQLSLDVVLLPATIEGGPASADEALYAVDAFYTFDDKGSRFAAILAVVDLGGSGPVLSGRDGAVFTLGAGAVLKGLTPGLELYAEVYFQFGSAGVLQGATDQDLDAGGLAFQVGGQFTLDTGLFFGANITLISGDDDFTDGDVDSFLSYENVNDLFILEDMYFGIDWDSNYFAIKFSGGIPLQIKTKDDLVISAILGITKTNEDVAFGPDNEDALGTEFDVRARWAVTKQASLQAGVGFLFGSDILEQSLGGSGAPDADDSAILYTVGADLRF
jgi:hypothetical protein